MAIWLAALCVLPSAIGRAAENPYIYGIHDTDPQPAEFLNHVKAQVAGSWLTATVAVGHNPSDTGGMDFSWYANQGHTVICRINNGYCGSGGTIPLPDQYADFAQRCANFVTHSTGCTIWVIGNETNLASEWPPSGNHLPYVSPQSYAECFRACYNAIKAARPTHRVVSQGLAPWGGPYGAGNACGCTHDAMPLNWVQYMNQMLTAIKNSGGIDGIALHVPSRGYSYADIHSTQKISAGGQYLYWSFYCYKDWIDLGIPPELYDRPLYVTECNGNYYWKGGHPEDPAKHYEAGWIQEVLREFNAYNQNAITVGKPIFRCINFYRWCAWCDGWNIDGADNPYKAQILGDLDAALAFHYTWPTPPSNITANFTVDKASGTPPLTVQFTDQSTGTITTRLWDFGDGDQSTAVNPSHVYEVPGTYTVSLTVAGPTGSDTETKTDYITATAGVEIPLIRNGGFSEGTAHWTKWTERDAAANFTTSVINGQLRCTGSNYNGGVYQQFSTGGAGRRITIAGYWKSNPTIAAAQWGEIIVINSARLPVDGTDETPASKPDDVLIFKNDTWNTPNGWDGPMTDTAPVANLTSFVAAADKATIIIKSGNVGGGMTGLVADNLDVRIRRTKGDLDTDGDVDLPDFAYFQLCFNGPNHPPKAFGCDLTDFDTDTDVDLADFAVFQACFNGPNRPPKCQ